MDLTKATSKDLIFLDKSFRNKEDVFDFMAQKLFEQGKISSKEGYLQAVYEREKISVTGFENGLAIPHGKSDEVIEASFAVLRLSKPLEDYPSLDPNNKVDLIFMLAIPEKDAGTTHLDILAKLSGRLSDTDYLAKFRSATNEDEILKLLSEDLERKETTKSGKGLILGITACAAGIAHTYMAAEAITKAANKLGYDARIEKQGAKGLEDRFTSEELKNAVGVIFAHDVALKELDRFKHLPKIDTNVAQPIKDPEGVISNLLDKTKNHDYSKIVESDFSEDDFSKKAVSQEIKDSILTGISYIIPIIIAGGMISTVAVLLTQIFGLQELAATEGSWLFLLKGLGGGLLGNLMIPMLSGYMAYAIADRPGLTPGFAGGLAALTINSGFLGGMLSGLLAGFLMKWMKENIKPKGVFSGFVTFWVYPVIGSLIVGIIMLFIVGKPVAALNTAMINWLDALQGTNAVLLGAVLGAMVSFDLGGPVNKAAYAFCIGAMSNGNYVPYCAFASVKMVSAFSLTVACMVRKDLFTEQEREVGNQTWLLGLAGITEGAIPFAMGDPIRVIGSFIGGSIVTGAIVAYAGVGLNVPGAGIFSMFLLEGNYTGMMGAFIWLGAALVGTVVSTILLILTRKQKLKKIHG